MKLRTNLRFRGLQGLGVENLVDFATKTQFYSLFFLMVII